MQKKQIVFPASVVWLVEQLEQAGYEAFAVGGCVRDSLLGRPPHDWDLCTSATPAQTAAVFSGLRVLEIGARHGTVSVLLKGELFEVTTYRVEGAYSDHRRPDAVSFSTTLREDLCRRDFTINAMAAHPSKGLVDFYDGRRDLENRQIRCVGAARERFGEDPLRIMRALRFAAVLDFEIEPDTERILRESAPLLRLIAAERLGAELCGLLRGAAANRMLADFPEVFAILLPPLFTDPASQESWQQAARAVGFSDGNSAVCLYQLVYSLVKQQDFTLKIEHLLRSMRLVNRLIRQICSLAAEAHTAIPTDPAALCRLLGRLRPEGVKRLLLARRAQLLALPESATGRQNRLEALDGAQRQLERLLRKGGCYDRAGLAINGSDLLEAGIASGKELGRLLDRLVEAVAAGRVKNRREALLSYAAAKVY